MKLTTLCLALSMTVAAAVASIACTSAVEFDADGKKADSDGKGNGSDESASTNGSSGGEETKVVTTKTGIPCDVDAILKKNCQTCHGAEPISGANTALVTWDDMMKPGPGAQSGKKVWELVKARIHDDARPMPAAPAPRIAGKDLEVMDKWFAAGAKADEATCTGNAPAESVKPLSCKTDTILKASEKFTMAADTPLDSYQCFGVDVNVPAKRHVIGLAPNVDNAKIVHHILLFQTDKAEPTKPFACEAFGSAAWKLIAGWAPGGNNLELPPEAGFPQEKGTTHWVLQIHYNNAAKAAAQDNSGYSLCTTDKLRPNDAGVVAFGSTKFNLPPRASSTIKCDYKLNAKYNGVKMFNASPHMHTAGTAMTTEKLAGGEGTPTPVFEQKNFSFEAQSNYPINVSVQEGDVMRTRCSYKNPGDSPIVFGEGTGDEMCFNFIGYYPAIPDRTPLGLPLQTWVTPSALAKCTME